MEKNTFKLTSKGELTCNDADNDYLRLIQAFDKLFGVHQETKPLENKKLTITCTPIRWSYNSQEEFDQDRNIWAKERNISLTKA